MTSPNYAVCMYFGKWIVRRHGTTRATKTFTNKGEAVRYGKALSIKSGGVLFVHRNDGRVENKHDFSK